MTLRETAEQIHADFLLAWDLEVKEENAEFTAQLDADLVNRIEAALRAAHEAGYNEGTDEIIVNAQQEYLRGQSDERTRCAEIAEGFYEGVKAIEAVSNDDGDRGAMCAAEAIARAIRDDKDQ